MLMTEPYLQITKINSLMISSSSTILSSRELEPLTLPLGCTYTGDPDGTLVADPTKYIVKVLETYEHTFGPNQKRPGHHLRSQTFWN